MNRILIGLAASALMLSVSAGAFAQNNGGSTGTGVGGAGSGGASAGNTQGGTDAMTPEQKKKAEMETKKSGATSGAAAETNADASQSKRTGDEDKANSGSK
jgi:hypothetical protein